MPAFPVAHKLRHRLFPRCLRHIVLLQLMSSVVFGRFMFEFLDGRKKRDQFVAWAAWVNVWAALFIFILAMAGACKFIDKFTRFSGDLFGMLIAVLFLQQAIKASLPATATASLSHVSWCI